jgi:hypothetical protein
MGGVRARFAEGDVFSCPRRLALHKEPATIAAKINCRVFMHRFYQKRPEIGREASGALRMEAVAERITVGECGHADAPF